MRACTLIPALRYATAGRGGSARVSADGALEGVEESDGRSRSRLRRASRERLGFLGPARRRSAVGAQVARRPPPRAPRSRCGCVMRGGFLSLQNAERRLFGGRRVCRRVGGASDQPVATWGKAAST
jgi:hypothetical protein